MLTDAVRMEAYEKAEGEFAFLKIKLLWILGRKRYFEFIFLRYGVGRVFSIEASDMALLCKKQLKRMVLVHLHCDS